MAPGPCRVHLDYLHDLGLALGEPIRDTIIAIATLLAATLEVSTAQYNKLNGGDL